MAVFCMRTDDGTAGSHGVTCHPAEVTFPPQSVYNVRRHGRLLHAVHIHHDHARPLGILGAYVSCQDAENTSPGDDIREHLARAYR